MAVFVFPRSGIVQIWALYDDCAAKRYSSREPARHDYGNAAKNGVRPPVYQTENKPDNILRRLPYPQHYFDNRFHFLFALQIAIGNSLLTSKHGHCFIHAQRPPPVKIPAATFIISNQIFVSILSYILRNPAKDSGHNLCLVYCQCCGCPR